MASTRLMATVEDLRYRASLSIEEARRITGYSRPRIDGLLDSGELLWFWEGKRRRVITASIFDRQKRLAMLAMQHCEHIAKFAINSVD